MTKAQEKAKLKKEILVFRQALKYLDKGFKNDKCKGYAPGCPNCQSQLFRGSLEEYIDLLKFEIDEL